jgi:ligand-binding sensor domain-containing protein/signal transduction histidine kinase
MKRHCRWGSVTSPVAWTLLWLVSLCLFAHASAPGVDDVRFRQIGVAQGLSQATVRTMVQDRQGFIWLGTQDGLNRFDGTAMRVFRHDPIDPHSLSDNNIIDLAIDAKGRLWIVTQSGGLNQFDPVTARFYRYTVESHGLISNVLERVHVDADGRIWVQTETGNLQWLDMDSNRFQSPEAFDSPVNLLEVFEDGHLLLASGHQLKTWAPGQQQPESLSYLDLDDAEIHLAVVDDEYLWAGTVNHGLFQLDRNGRILRHWTRKSIGAPGLIDNQVRSLMMDRHGALWVGTLAGLSRIEPDRQQVRHWRHDPSDPLGINGARIVSLLEDESGLVWVGSWTGGASVHDPHTSAFVLIRNRPDQPLSLPGNAIASMLENPDGTLWMAVLDVGGLVHFDPDHGVLEWHQHDPDQPNGLPHRMVGSLLHDEDDLLVGMLGGGLVRFNNHEGVFERLIDDPEQDVSRTARVENIQRTSDGSLWVTTIGDGIYRRCPTCEGFQHFRSNPEDPNSLPDDEINGILETDDGTLWVAMRRKGLARFDSDTLEFEHFPASAYEGGLRHNSVTGMYQARNGTVWMGTQGGGVHRLDQTRPTPSFTVINRANGLDADAIGEIAEDRQGHIWVSSTSGLSRIEPDTLKVENFPFVDGYSGAGFFIGSIDRHWPEHVWFGGVRGLVRVDFDRVIEPRESAHVVLTDLLLLNQPIQPGSRQELPRSLSALEQLTLPHDRGLLTMEFVAPGTLRNRHNLRYAYRLLGLDDEWIETSPERAFASFTALPVGDYTLQVRAGIQPGEWGPITELDLEILPPPWRDNRAIALYALSLGLLLLAIAWRIHLGLTRRHNAQREIAASRERLRMALWGSRDELWEADTRTNSLVRENRMDRSYEDDDTVHMTLEQFWDSIHPDDVEELKREYIDHVKGKTDYFEAEFRGRSSPETPWRWMLSRGRITERDEQGRALRLSGTTRDISHLKETEEKLRRLNEELESRVRQRTRELETSNETLQKTLTELQQAQRYLVQTEKMAALGGLVAGIAHEINTPLGVGVTAASHLESETRKFQQALELGEHPDPKRLAAFAQVAGQSGQMILRNLRRADELVKSFKQVAVDQASEQRRTFQLDAYINEILISLQPELKRSPHRIELQLSRGMVMDTYPGALYQILVNLVMNSLTHAWEPGETGTIHIGASMDGDTVRLTYQDDGKGMPEEVADQMFDPFFTTRRGQGGSGLGLHIVYNLVTRVLRGDIEADTSPDKGLRFEIVMPRIVPDEQA